MAKKKQPIKILKKLKSFTSIDVLETYLKKNRKEVLEKLMKIKNALEEEGEHSVDMFETYARYTQGKASEKEMSDANKQFGSLLKTIGLGFFAILPGAPITIPILIKISSKLGVDIMPNSFHQKKKNPNKK